MSGEETLPVQPADPRRKGRHLANKLVLHLVRHCPARLAEEAVASGTEAEQRQFRQLCGGAWEPGGQEAPGGPALPMQPIAIDAAGTPRFVANGIVRALLDKGPLDLNDVAWIEAPRSHESQLMQLIGFSVDGFADLGCSSRSQIRQADEIARRLREEAEGQRQKETT